MNTNFSFLLRPFALLYGKVVQLRNLLFDKKLLRPWRSLIPVVSVGNLSVGGTGKTPMVDWIVKYYLSIGYTPAIVSRGYKRETKGVQLVSDGQKVLLGCRDAGDEIAMLAWNNPNAIVVVAEKRKDGIKFMMKHFASRPPSVIILDDAFQHRQLDRWLDIVLVNATEPFFDAKMLPEGRLREPLSNITRANLVVVTKISDNEQAAPIVQAIEKTGRPVVKARIKVAELACVASSSDMDVLPNNIHALAFAGIASPENFVETLQSKGITVAASRFFNDHEPYNERKLRSIAHEAEEKGLSLITTEKDYFRILGQPELIGIMSKVPCYYLKIETEVFEGKALLQEKLNEVVHYVPKPEPPKKIEEPYRRW